MDAIERLVLIRGLALPRACLAGVGRPRIGTPARRTANCPDPKPLPACPDENIP